MLALLAWAGESLALSARFDPMQRENARPGSTSWQVPVAQSTVIAGYSVTASVAPGARLELAVSTAVGVRYRVEVYRLGWYQDKGGRLVACLPSCAGSRLGQTQPSASPDWSLGGEVQEHWHVTDSLPGTRDWMSGYYLAELVVTSGAERGKAAIVPFIVRGPDGDRSAILVQAPVDTWQAYNDYGGTSLYTGPDGRRADRVSFDRPYATGSSQSPFYYEYPLVRFLERHGYDVSYTTDVDVDRDPAQLLRHRLLIVAGHSEYWTTGMEDGLVKARDAGVNLAFIGGNDVYHSVSFEQDRRAILKQPLFRDLSPARSECELVGVAWQGGWVDDGLEPGSSAGAFAHSRDYAVTASALQDAWLAGTGLTPSSTLRGLVGYEWDAIEPGCSLKPTVLFHYQGEAEPSATPWERAHAFVSTNADATRYTAPSGATVFAAGSIEFSWGLDGYARRFNHIMVSRDEYPPNRRLQRFMRNLLEQLAGQPRRP